MRTVNKGYVGGYAPYPANGYPVLDFMGAGTIAPRTGTGGGNPVAQTQATGVGALLPSTIAKSTPLAIIVVVAVGYLIWHISARV